VPSVCLQKEVLLGQGELCEYIYIMMRGALQVRDAPASDFELKPARSDASSGAIAFAAARLVRGACRAVLRAAGVKRLPSSPGGGGGGGGALTTTSPWINGP
jgi:hypothetical protein